jgi:Zn-dependent protease with chaperone function
MPLKPITKEEFSRIVVRLAEQAQKHPRLFRLRVSLMNAYGYWILFGIPLSFLVLGLLWFPLLIVGLFVAIASTSALVRALRVVFQQPKGLVLEPSTTPELFRIIESVRAELHASPVGAVVLTTDFNASMIEVPRFAFAGWKSYLQIGFPLTLGLSARQFRALVAHELAHLAHSHSRAKLRLIRVRAAALRLLNGYGQRRGIFPAMFNALLMHYMPRIDACIFVLGREFESDCDMMAARASSARDIAEVLVRLSSLGSFNAIPYWTGVWKLAGESAIPPARVYEGLSAALAEPVELPKLIEYLEKALHQPTGPLDSHPSLSQRLIGLGFSRSACEIAAWLQPHLEPVVDSLFTANRAFVFEQMDRVWSENSAKPWAAQHANLAAFAATRNRLGSKAGHAPLSVGEMFELAFAISQLEGMARAVPQFEALLQAAPDFLTACELFGTYLLGQGKPEGIAPVERAIEKNPVFRVAGYNALADYYARHGTPAVADRYKKLAAATATQSNEAKLEGNRISIRDGLHVSGLSREQLDRFAAAAKKVAGLDRLYILGKPVKWMPDMPCYIFVATELRDWHHPFRQDPQFIARLMAAMKEVGVPPRSHFFRIRGAWRLMYHIRQIAGAEVYNSSRNQAR